MVARMISIRTSRVNSRVLERPSRVVELTVIVMFEGEAIKATIIPHQYDLRLRLLMKPSQSMINICQQPASALFYPSSTFSYVSLDYVARLGATPEPLFSLI